MYKPSKPLKQPENSEHGFNYAMFLLNLSAKTEAELIKKMKTRGYVQKVIDEAIEKLKGYNYINDEKYAEGFISSMKNYKTFGYFSIRQKMTLKLLPKSLIEESLKEYFTLKDEKEVLTRYLEKELKSFFDPGKKQNPIRVLKEIPYEERQKFIRKIASRGFRMDLVL